MEKNMWDSNAITRDYFDSLLLEMRHFDAVLPSTKLELFGEVFDTPVMMAAFSHMNNVRENGMVEIAKGAFTANAVNWSGMIEDAELADVIATKARTVSIVKPYADQDKIFRKLAFAERCGALAVGMDLDHSFGGTGRYDVCMGEHMIPKTRTDVEAYIKATKLPFIIKGVLSEQDAYKALEVGAKGIVVSHHHGIMPYAVPPLMILPKIAQVIDRKIPIFVDCGFVSGMDVFKALALGADAVSLGRVICDPLKAEGGEGVRKLIVRVTEELAGAMARTCSPSLRQIDPSLIWHK